MIKNKSDYITSFEAASILGLSPDYIRKLLNDGKIKGTKLGHNWLLKKKEIENIRQRNWLKTEKGTK